MWKTGANAIVVTWDEGNTATDRVPTIVITNHGPRGLTDKTSYNHYSLLTSLQDAFGLGCLQNSCTATAMGPLFSQSGPATTPALPTPVVPAPNGTHTVSHAGTPMKGPKATLGASGWQVVPSPSIGDLDNNLDSVSAASATDAWAVGTYYPPGQPNVLATLGEHWDGTRWTAYPLPNVGLNENTLFGVSALSSGRAWAVGYYISPDHHQRTLVEHWDGSSWHVVPSPEPGAKGRILYGVAAIRDNDVWAVGGQQHANGIWHPLTEHWDGSRWSVISTPDPNDGANLLYSISAVSSTDVSASGQTGTAFPSQALIQHWNGSRWSTVNGPVDRTQSLDPFGMTATRESLTLVGARESDVSPFTTLVASGPPSNLGLVSSTSDGTGENDLFTATTAGDGSTWAAGWYIDPSTGDHETLTEHRLSGHWSIVPSPSPSANGDNGLAAITSIPGGGLWAAGISTNSAGNPSTLIEFHP